MKILSKEISDKTAELISSVELSARQPIKYYPLNKNANPSYAGRVDVFGGNGHYTVYLNTSLPQDAFESDILHELRHIVQIENGYSSVFNKESADFHSADRSFVEELGSHIASTVLDFEVNTWLEKNGYDYSFFTKHNYEALLDHSNQNYQSWRDPLNYANIVCALLHASLYVDDKAADVLFNAYSDRYQEVVADAVFLRSYIKSLNIDTPMKAAVSHCQIINTLKLWTHFYVIFRGKKIRTNREFLALKGEASFD